MGNSSFVFIQLFHIPTQWFWIPFGANAVGLIGCSQINGRLVQRIAPHIILRRALIVAAIAGILLLAAATLPWPASLLWLRPVAFFTTLFIYMSTAGFIFPSSVALAMGPQGRIAGNASALIGFLQFLISGCGAWLVTILFDGTARPMTLLMFLAAAAALAVNLLLAHPRHEAAMTALSVPAD